MSKTKKLPKYVTYQMLAQFAKAADATFALRLNAMEERLRAEFGNGYAPYDSAILHNVTPQFLRPDATYEGNHLAPTPAEGAE